MLNEYLIIFNQMTIAAKKLITYFINRSKLFQMNFAANINLELKFQKRDKTEMNQFKRGIKLK